jgi:dsRNA-specific ribonuclease
LSPQQTLTPTPTPAMHAANYTKAPRCQLHQITEKNSCELPHYNTLQITPKHERKKIFSTKIQRFQIHYFNQKNK